MAWAAGLAFASVTIAGCCLALGVALGQWSHQWSQPRKQSWPPSAAVAAEEERLYADRAAPR